MTKRIDKFDGEHAFLSNFYEHPFDWRGDTWRTAEHALQAAKAVETVDYFRIRDAATPGKAKRLGRACRLRDGWTGMRVGVMLEILRAKFSVPKLRGMLVATGGAELVEGNDWGDEFWGVDSRTGEGQNQLGVALMLTRDLVSRA